MFFQKIVLSFGQWLSTNLKKIIILAIVIQSILIQRTTTLGHFLVLRLYMHLQLRHRSKLQFERKNMAFQTWHTEERFFYLWCRRNNKMMCVCEFSICFSAIMKATLLKFLLFFLDLLLLLKRNMRRKTHKENPSALLSCKYRKTTWFFPPKASTARCSW